MDQNVDDGVNQDSSLDTRGRNILEEFSLMNTKAIIMIMYSNILD